MVALSIFSDKMLVENWSLSGYKSDFKEDQKIRKAMFSRQEVVWAPSACSEEIQEGSRLIRANLLFILNPFSSQSCHSPVPNLPDQEYKRSRGFTTIFTCIDPRWSRDRPLLRKEEELSLSVAWLETLVGRKARGYVANGYTLPSEWDLFLWSCGGNRKCFSIPRPRRRFMR